MMYTDAELVAWIEEALLTDLRLSAQPLHVEAHDGVVTLSGHVQAEERKQLALAIAAAHPACRSVVDQIRVVAPQPQSDPEIAASARAALATLVAPVRQGAQVSVTNGVVTLHGSVPTEWERAVAADVVLAAPGVRAVANNLLVADAAPAPRPSESAASAC